MHAPSALLVSWLTYSVRGAEVPLQNDNKAERASIRFMLGVTYALALVITKHNAKKYIIIFLGLFAGLSAENAHEKVLLLELSCHFSKQRC